MLKVGKRSGLWFVVTWIIVTTVSSCVVVDDLTPPDGVTTDGSCMCAFCLDRPFCFREDDANTLENEQDTDTDNAGACLPGYVEAVESSRVIDKDNKSGIPAVPNFFCVAPAAGKSMTAPLTCATGNEAFEFVDECLDVPRSCLSDDQALACFMVPDPGPQCSPSTQFGARRNKCGQVTEKDYLAGIDEGKGNAVGKLVTECGTIHGVLPPGGADAERYCFLSCVGFFGTCSVADTDPPEVRTLNTHGAVVSPSFAVVQVQIGSDLFTEFVDVVGDLHVEIPHACIGPTGTPALSCDATLSQFRMHGTSFIIDGNGVEDVKVENTAPMPANIVTFDDVSIMTVPASAVLHSSATIVGQPSMSNFMPSTSLVIGIDWTTRQANLVAVLSDPAANASMSLSLTVDLVNLPPKANAGPDQALECAGPDGAVASLSASSSTDHDGAADIVAHRWAYASAGSIVTHGGATLTPRVATGASQVFNLRVEDSRAASDVDSVSVAVADTTPPTFGEVSSVTDCLWPPNHKFHLFRLDEELTATASDTCDDSPVIRIAAVTSSEAENGNGDGNTAPDVIFGGGSLCVRAERSGNGNGRDYTVTIETEDNNGNVASQDIVIHVPRNQGQGNRCTTGDLAPEVADGDPRCQLPAPVTMLVNVATGDPAGDVQTLQGLAEVGPANPSPAGCSMSPSPTRVVSPLWAAFLVLPFLGRRRRIVRVAGAAALALGLLGCGKSDKGASATAPPVDNKSSPSDPAKLEACAQGVWLFSEGKCLCFDNGSPLNTAECGESDCVHRGVLVLREDGQAIELQIRQSASRGTFSAIGGDIATTASTWEITTVPELAQVYSERNVWTSPAICEELRLERLPTPAPGNRPRVNYSRAPAGLHDAILQAWSGGSWTDVSYVK